MGTRHLTMVISEGQTRIAQYGQWDGYPSGQGRTILDFLRTRSLDKFRRQLRKCRWISLEQIEEGYVKAGAKPEAKFVGEEVASKFNAMYPFLTRNHGAGILALVADCDDEEILLRDSSDFAGDSIFCEYAYVIDLDKQTLEVYKGFNHSPVPAGERFAHIEQVQDSYDKTTKYYPVRLAALYSLDSLPGVKELCSTVDPPEEEEAA